MLACAQWAQSDGCIWSDGVVCHFLTVADHNHPQNLYLLPDTSPISHVRTISPVSTANKSVNQPKGRGLPSNKMPNIKKIIWSCLQSKKSVIN